MAEHSRSGDASQAASGAGLRLFVLIVSFLGLPLLLGLFGLRQMWQEREEARRIKLERRLEDVLASFDRYVNTDRVVERLLRRLETLAFASRADPIARLRKLLPLYRRALPGCFEFTVLDGEGRPVPGLCDGPAPRVILRRLFIAASESHRGNPQPWRADEGMIHSLLGPLSQAKGFTPSRLAASNLSDRYRFVYLSRPTSSGMLMVRVSQLPSWTGLGVRMHLKRLRLPSSMKVGLIDRQRLPRRMAGRTEWDGLQSSLQGKSWNGRRLRDMLVLSPRYQVCGQALLLRDKDLESRKRIILRGGILGLIGVSLFLWIGLRIGWIPTPSVRAGMIVAFVYSAGIPLLVLAGTARVLLQERRLVLEDQAHRSIGREMQSFDSRYPRRLRHFSLNLSEALAAIVCPETDPAADIFRGLDKARKVIDWDLCQVFDQTGRVVVYDESKKVFNHMSGAFDMMNNPLARVLEMMRVHGPGGSSVDDQSMDAMYAKLLGHLGTISDLELSGVRYLSLLYPLFDRAGLPRFMLHMVWTRQRMQLEFLRHELQPFSRQLDATDLLAWNVEQSSFSLPRRFRHQSLVAPFLPKVCSQSRETRMRVAQADGAVLLTGIRGTYLDDYSLVAVTNDRSIRAELDVLAWKLGGAAVLMLLVSVTIGMVVARAFLEPVGLLATGIESLAERRFSARVPIAARDELGRLAEAFNEMMEGLADLEVARTVQDALFPDGPLRVGSWELFGRCCNTAQIGGDYFDYVALDERRLLFLIGDVTGHGVSAALVMAMAKAVTVDVGRDGTPVGVLTALNAVFEKVLHGRKSMSCLVGIFDVIDRRLTICNGGHCYPYLIHAGKARHLEIPGMLIGMGSRWRASLTREFILEPGDCLVGYTDALYETNDRFAHQPIGFGGVEKALPGLVRGLATETEKAIREWHARTAASGGTDDDLTLLVLHAAPSMENGWQKGGRG